MRPTPPRPRCRQRHSRHPTPCPAQQPSLCRAVREMVPGLPRTMPRHGDCLPKHPHQRVVKGPVIKSVSVGEKSNKTRGVSGKPGTLEANRLTAARDAQGPELPLQERRPGTCYTVFGALHPGRSWCRDPATEAQSRQWPVDQVRAPLKQGVFRCCAEFIARSVVATTAAPSQPEAAPGRCVVRRVRRLGLSVHRNGRHVPRHADLIRLGMVGLRLLRNVLDVKSGRRNVLCRGRFNSPHYEGKHTARMGCPYTRLCPATATPPAISHQRRRTQLLSNCEIGIYEKEENFKR